MKQFLVKVIPVSLFLFLVSFSYGQVVINEYSASNLTQNTDNYGEYEDWVELYNTGTSSVGLGGYFLSDNPDELQKWAFPEGATIGSQSFMKIWLTGRNLVSGNNYHTSFKLTQTKDTKEHIILSNALGVIQDDIILSITQKNHSNGRSSNGSGNWSIFTTPTPGSSNNNATDYSHYADKPVVSDTAGFYEGSVQVSFTTTEPNSEIHYTTDGSEPTASSPLYTSPINITSTTIVIARTFSSISDVLPSLLEFNTYFIDVDHTLAVMSFSAAELDNLLNGNQSLRPFGTFEYFNADGERTTYGYGEFNEHGQDSWVHDQRSIDYVSRDECGYDYAIHEKMIPLTDRDEFQRVILRAAGDDNYPGIDTSALLRDYFVQNTAQREGLHLDVRKGQKGLMYANGTYWGVYGFREKVNDHDFTDYYYDQGKYDIYYLMLWGGSWAEYGGQAAWDDWNDLHDFIKYNDMGVQSNYDYVKTRLDYASLVDYILINSYVVCSDWINWNVGWWRGTNPEGGHQKWGYVLWDEDATFAHYINYTGVPGISPYTSPCYPEGLTSDPQEHIVMLNHLMENDEFYKYYVNRHIDLFNTAFRPDKMNGYLSSIEAEMAPEMPDHVDRWGGTVTQWENNVQKIKNFISARHSYLPTGLVECYDLSGPYEVNFSVDPPNAGIIRINSTEIEGSYFGGYYFGGIETDLEAIHTNANYEFSHWELFNNTISPSDTMELVSLTIEEGDFITAVFNQVAFADSLVINEINYNADVDFDCEDWVEFYNPHDYALDITGWEFKDNNDQHVFEFPENTVIEPNDYLVLSRDTAIFSSFFPDVDNLIGDFDFGLSSSGELIRLFDSTGILIDTVHYDNNLPWPEEPDGGGQTLELKYWTYDNALPESWIASAEHGTPGEMNGYTVDVTEMEAEQAFAFVIYPNPMKQESVLQVTTGHDLEGCNISIYNFYGEAIRVYSNVSGSKMNLTAGQFAKGIYICVIHDKDGVRLGQQKLVVE